MVTMGVWIYRQSVMSGAPKAYSFGFMRIQPILVIIVCIALAVACMILLAFGGTVVDIFKSVASGEQEIIAGGQTFKIEQADFDQLKNMLDRIEAAAPGFLDTFIEQGKTIMIVVSVVGLAVDALVLIAAFKTLSIIGKIRNTLMYGYDEPIKTGFVVAMLYIFAGFMVISFLTSLIMKINDPVSAISMLVSAGLMVTAALYFSKVKEIME